MRHLLSSTALSSCLLAGLASALAASGAQAQTAPAAPDAAEVGAIIVTAQKREQNLQDVPQAVQVVSGAQLTASAVREFSDLTRVAPSLIVRPAENPVNASVSVRGVGTFAFSIGVEPSVAVQVDDAPVAFQARAFTDLSDIERVEVLRGPQSTLYGKSASAGLINIVTKAPTKTFTANVGGLITTDQEYGVNGAISGPITDNLGFRLSGNYDNYNGNVRNLATGSDVNGRENFSTRGKLVWDPTKDINVTLGADYIDGSTTIGRPFIAVSPNASLRGVYSPAQFAPGVTFGPDNRDVVNNLTSGTDYKGFGQTLKASWDLGPATLMSITSHDQFRLNDYLDQDESAIAALDNRQTGSFKSKQLTQELRLVSPGSDPFRYTLGLFYADVNFQRDFFRGPYFSLARWLATSQSQQKSAFGQVEWDILPKTTLIGGIRFGNEKLSYSFLDIQNGGVRFQGDANDNYKTYKAGVQQKLTDDIMVFATFATGHKGQAFDLSTGFNLNRQLAGPVLPETSKDYELGARTQFFDRRLTLNLTLFDTKYQNFQAQGIETLPDGTVNYRLANVGALETKGVELESTTRVNSDLTIGASIAYLDAKITSYPLAQCYPGQTAAQGCTGSPGRQNLAGAAPPQAPKIKTSVNFDYSHPLGSLPLEAVVHGAYSYQSKINYSLNQDPQTAQGGYGIINLSAGVRNPVKHYEIMAFVNNLTDQQYYSNMINSLGNYNNQQATQSYLPRDFRRYAGVRFSYSF